MNCCGTKLLMGETLGRYDGHCHVFRKDLPMVPNRRYTPGYHALPETLCQQLSAHKLDGALLVQPSFLGTDNQYLLQTIAHLRNQTDLVFRGVVVLDPDCPPTASEFESLNTQGVIGLRLNLYKDPQQFDYGKWRALLNLAENLEWHIELHCESGRLPQVLPTLVKNHNNIVIDHFGLVTSVNTCKGLAAILQQPPEKLWIKVSAPYRLKQHLHNENGTSFTESLESLYQIFSAFVGTERLVWGSDWPFTQFEEEVSYSQLEKNYTA